MEKMPNVEIDFMPFERATWQDQINTRVAGGDIPDIIYRDSQSVVAQYVKQGIICEVPISKAKEYAPTIYEATKEYGEEVWLAAYADGKNWGLPSCSPALSLLFQSLENGYVGKSGCDGSAHYDSGGGGCIPEDYRNGCQRKRQQRYIRLDLPR